MTENSNGEGTYVFQLLPYSEQIYAENEVQLQQIFSNISNWKQGETKTLLFWCKQLEKYIHLKNPIPSHDLEFLITTLLTYVFNSRDIVFQTKVISTILELLGSYDSYNTIKVVNETFQINWKDLYHLLERNHLIEVSMYCGNNPLRYNLHSLKALVQKSRKYFLKRGVQYDHENSIIIREILETFFSSNLSVIEEYSIHIRQGLVSLFVPTNTPIAVDILLPFIFKNWELVENCKNWDINWLGMLGRLSETTFRNSNFKVWEKHIISEIFTHLIKALDISIPNRVNKPKQNSIPSLIAEFFAPSVHLDIDIMKCTSKIVAYTLSDQTETLNHYIQLLDLIYSYFHPSNGGEWSAKLGKLISVTAKVLESRIWFERYVIKKQHLSSEILEKFAMKTFEVAIQGIYSKNDHLCNFSQSTMASLSWIYPSILPQLLSKLDQGLVTLNAIHQTSTSLMSLAQITTAMVNPNHFKDGASYLYNILENTLPGIDTNDLTKSYACLSFYLAIFATIPFYNLSDNSTNFETEYENQSSQYIAQSQSMKEISQSLFENFALLFIDRIMLFFSHITNEEDSEYESLSIQVSLVVNLFLAHLSPSILRLVLNRVYNYITKNIESNAKFEFLVIVAALAKSAPEPTLELFIPHLTSLVQMTDQIPSFDKNDSTEKLEWEVNILLGLVDGSTGSYLVKYQSQLMTFIHCCLLNENKTIFKLGIEISRNLLQRLTEIYICDFNYFRNQKEIRWGRLFQLHQVTPIWYQPSDVEINFAVNLVNDLYGYTKMTFCNILDRNSEEIDSPLAKLATQKTEKLSQKLMMKRGMSVLRLILEGGDLLFQSPNIYHRSPYDLGSSRLIYPLSIRDNRISDPVTPFDGHLDQVYFEIGELIHSLYLNIPTLMKDDMSNMKSLAKLMKIYMGGSDNFESEYRNYYMIYYSMKQMFRSILYIPSPSTSTSPTFQKYLLFEAQLTRIMSLHLHRMSLKKHCKIMHEIHQKIMEDLFSLCFNSYVQVREKAQYHFKVCLKIFPKMKKHYLKRLFENITLSKSSSSSDRVLADKVKGSLHLLMSNNIFKYVISNWKLQLAFITAITSQLFYFESTSIQKLLFSLILSFNSQYYPLPLSSSKANYQIQYENIITTLVQSVSNSETNANNWKFRSMIACLLYFYQSRDDVATSIDIFKWYLSNLTSDILPVRAISLLAIPSLIKIPLSPPLSFLQLGSSNPSNSSPQQFCDYLSQFSINSLNENQQEIFSILFQHFFKDEDYFSTFLRFLAEGRTLRSEEEHSDTKLSNFIYSIRSSVKTKLSSAVNHNLAKQLTFDIIRNSTLLRIRNSFPYTRGRLLSEDYSVEISRFFSTVYTLLMTYSVNHRETYNLFEKQVNFIHSHLIDANSYQIEEEKRSQLYTEIFGGLMRSIIYQTTRNISKKEYSEYWNLLSVVNTTLFRDNYNNWGSTEDVTTSIRFAFSLIDPTRYLDNFIPKILSTQNNSTSIQQNGDNMDVNGNDWLSYLSNLNVPSQRHLKKLVCLADILTEANYRLNYCSVTQSNGKEVIFTDGLLQSLLQHMDHPYLQIRVAISAIIYLIFVYSWKMNNKETLTLFVNQLPSLIAQKELLIENQLNSSDKQLLESLRKSLSNTLETCILFVMNHLQQSSIKPLYEYIHVLLPIVFKGVINSEKEVSQRARACLALAALSFYGNPTLSRLLSTVMSPSILYSDHWRLREVSLPFIQLIAFNHRFVLTSGELKKIHECVIKLLNDQQIEVRELACTCLSSLLRGSSHEYISELTDRFENLAKTKLELKRKLDSDSLDPSNITSNLQRYSGILGLIALVKLAPYDIPPWYPRVLLSLVKHVNDPIVISKVVKKTLQDFWRTHSDMWDTCKGAFSSEELEILNGLIVSPSYYA